MKPSVVVAALLGFGAVVASAAEVPTPVTNAVAKTAEKPLQLPKTLDELKALMSKIRAEDPDVVSDKAGDAGDAAKSVKRVKELPEQPTYTTGLLGLAKTALMTFTGICHNINDAYLDTLGIQWFDADSIYLPAEECGQPFSNPPTPFRVAGFGFCCADGKREINIAAFDGGFTSNDGLIGELSFYYATPAFLIPLSNTESIQKPVVSAWSGPAGTGKKLGEKVLDWTKGDFFYTFEKFEFKFKGVAKSITFTEPTINGNSVNDGLYIDNVEVKSPAGKATELAAGALEVEEKLADIQKELKDTLKNKD